MFKVVAVAAFALLAGTALALPQSTSIAGKWYWQGEAGWQRIMLDVKVDGKKFSGSIVMGAGNAAGNTPDQYWEFFFKPVSFPILNGKIDGSKISFEQAVVRGAGAKPEERLKYTGLIDRDALVITRQSRQLAEDAFVLGDHEFQFTLTRNPSVAASQPGAPLRPIDASRRMGVIHADVLDESGKRVPGLQLQDFMVLENGAARPVESFAASDAPWNVVALFDHGLNWLDATQKDTPNYVASNWRTLIDAASDFLDRLRPDDQFAVAAFEDRIDIAMDWRARRASVRGGRLTVTDAPRGQKDLYGAIRWALKKLEGKKGHKAAVIFTDGRDGRLSPRWLRASSVSRENPGLLQTLDGPRQRGGGGFGGRGGLGRFGGGPQTANTEAFEVLDPLFGLQDVAEAWEFQRLLSAVARDDVELHFVVVGADRDPEFGPAVIGRRISGLYPGAETVLDAYLAGVRARLETIAAVAGGRVHYGNDARDARGILSSFDQRLGVGAYRFRLSFATAQTGSRIEVRPVREGLRVRQFPGASR